MFNSNIWTVRKYRNKHESKREVTWIKLFSLWHHKRIKKTDYNVWDITAECCLKYITETWTIWLTVSGIRDPRTNFIVSPTQKKKQFSIFFIAAINQLSSFCTVRGLWIFIAIPTRIFWYRGQLRILSYLRNILKYPQRRPNTRITRLSISL